MRSRAVDAWRRRRSASCSGRDSPRFVEPARARDIAAALPPHVTAVGVFVDQPAAYVGDVASAGAARRRAAARRRVDRRSRESRQPLIKAVAVTDAFDAARRSTRLPRDVTRAARRARPDPARRHRPDDRLDASPPAVARRAADHPVGRPERRQRRRRDRTRAAVRDRRVVRRGVGARASRIRTSCGQFFAAARSTADCRESTATDTSIIRPTRSRRARILRRLRRPLRARDARRAGRGARARLFRGARATRRSARR